jgi:RNA polymerase sigma factor (sigma-70 family)
MMKADKSPEEIIGIARAIATKYFKDHHEFDDLMSTGIEKMIRYRYKFDKKRAKKVTFGSFLYHIAKQSMFTHMRTEWIHKKMICDNAPLISLFKREPEDPVKTAILNESMEIIGRTKKEFKPLEAKLFNHVFVNGNSARSFERKYGCNWKQTGHLRRLIRGKIRRALGK